MIWIYLDISFLYPKARIIEVIPQTNFVGGSLDLIDLKNVPYRIEEGITNDGINFELNIY